jgi:hypothetical protein
MPSIKAAHPKSDFRSDPEFFCHPDRNFPNWIQFLTFSGRSYANFCLLMCAKVRTHCKYMPYVRAAHPEPDFCSDPEFFCHPDPEFF